MSLWLGAKCPKVVSVNMVGSVARKGAQNLHSHIKEGVGRINRLHYL